jgi:hypothetical protein
MSSESLHSLAATLREGVFGPGTDLYLSFGSQEIAEALEGAARGDERTIVGGIVEAYELRETSVPGQIASLAMADKMSLERIIPTDDRLALARSLNDRVGEFLRRFPDRYPELCPEEFRDVAVEGLFSVVLKLARDQGAVLPVRRGLSIVPDSAGTMQARAASGAQKEPPDNIEIFLKRWMSLTQAREFVRSQEREAPARIGAPESHVDLLPGDLAETLSGALLEPTREISR